MNGQGQAALTALLAAIAAGHLTTDEVYAALVEPVPVVVVEAVDGAIVRVRVLVVDADGAPVNHGQATRAALPSHLEADLGTGVVVGARAVYAVRPVAAPGSAGGRKAAK